MKYELIELENDKIIESLINQELYRQQNTLELIASENIVSQDVLKACGSILTHKYAEGKKPKYSLSDDTEDNWKHLVFDDQVFKSLRYYCGCEIIDKIEVLACVRFQQLFNTDYHVNVQPHSGAQANMAVFEALLKHGDTVLSMDLSNGGHLSHGSSVNYSGKHFKVIHYGINENGEIDYDEVEKLVLKYKPKLIICGASNYSKVIDFERFGKIRDKLNAGIRPFYDVHYLLADIAHIAGLVAGGVHPSPFGIADVVTTTTHKSLRGPRGGVIACNPELANKIDSAVFPGIQGGPLEHIIAAKAVCFQEANTPQFKEYANQVVSNAKILCSTLLKYNMDIVGGMTENHLMTLDLSKKGLTGKEFAEELEKIGITANKNTVPNDPQSPFITSGVRIGTPAVTSRGLKEQDMIDIAFLILELKDAMVNMNRNSAGYKQKLQKLRNRSQQICEAYPIY